MFNIKGNDIKYGTFALPTKVCWKVNIALV